MRNKQTRLLLVLILGFLLACNSLVQPSVNGNDSGIETQEVLLPSETSAPTQVLVDDQQSSFSVTEIKDSMNVSMVLVPAGEFIMGSDIGLDNEKPIHTVYLDAFYIDKYEVTNALYKVCADAGVCKPPIGVDSLTRRHYYDDPEYANFPIGKVDWDMSRTYCEWRGGRLPTEAEWEKAARGTDGRIYPWGGTDLKDITCEHAAAVDLSNVTDISQIKSCVEDTVQVGMYEMGVSPYGAYDMAGNVGEWVSSLYQPYPYNPDDGREELNVTVGSRILRGGGLKGIEFYTTLRWSFEIGDIIDTISDYGFTGIRCAMDAK